MTKHETLLDRWWSRVEIQEDGCWLWTGGKWARGYGRFYVDGHRVSAHAWGYRALVGPVADGLELDHLCRNLPCVNPEHLEPVTHAENVRRGMAGAVNGARQRALTHCKAGHEFNEKNTRYWKGRRLCRLCDAIRAASYRAQHDHSTKDSLARV